MRMVQTWNCRRCNSRSIAGRQRFPILCITSFRNIGGQGHSSEKCCEMNSHRVANLCAIPSKSQTQLRVLVSEGIPTWFWAQVRRGPVRN